MPVWQLVPQTKPNFQLSPSARQCQILVQGPQLCNRIWVLATIDLLKKPLFGWPIRLEENLKCTSCNLLSCLGIQNKDLGAVLQMLLPGLYYVCNAGYACGCSCPIRWLTNHPWIFPTPFSSLQIERQLTGIWLINKNCRQNDLWKHFGPNSRELSGLLDGPLQ